MRYIQKSPAIGVKHFRPHYIESVLILISSCRVRRQGLLRRWQRAHCLCVASCDRSAPEAPTSSTACGKGEGELFSRHASTGAMAAQPHLATPRNLAPPLLLAASRGPPVACSLRLPRLLAPLSTFFSFRWRERIRMLVGSVPMTWLSARAT
jgi:hypothetical protein